jgi:hypothetical protein
MRATIRGAAAGLIAAGCALLASCSEERGNRLPETGATLEGAVTYGTEKVPFAIVFVQGPGAMAQAKVGEDGHYKVENVPLGEVKVGVNTNAAKGDYMSQSIARSYKGPDAKGKANVPMPKFIDVPERYANPEKSGIKTTVQPGANSYDIKVPR